MAGEPTSKPIGNKNYKEALIDEALAEELKKLETLYDFYSYMEDLEKKSLNDYYQYNLNLYFFKIEDYFYSDTANTLGIKNITKDAKYIKNIYSLASEVVDPLCQYWYYYCKRNKIQHSSITLSSGFRCAQLNDKLPKSASKSAHSIGSAVDLYPTNKNLFEQFKNCVVSFFNENNISFDQVIIESASGVRWVHIGYKRPSGNPNRKQIFSLNF